MEITSTQQLLGGIAVAIGLLGYAFYVRGILQGKVKPHAFSWFTWAVLTAIAFFAQVADGGGGGAWVTGITAICSIGFAIVGLGKSARVYISTVDWAFFICALISIPVWYFSGNPLLSVIIITIVDAAAFAPTFRKGFYNPETENVWTYALSGIKFIFAIFALGSFTWTTALYPVSLVLANSAFVIVLLWRRQTHKA